MASEVISTPIAAVVAWGFAKLAASAIVARRKASMYEKIGTVGELYMYPMKSGTPMTTNDALCTEVGLYKNGATDRHWMVVDQNDSVIDMIEMPKMVLVKSIIAQDTLIVSAPGMADLHLTLRPELDMAKTFIKVFVHQPIRVLHCGTEAASWISEFLGRPAKIVYSCKELGTRSIYERHRDWETLARPGDKTVFGYFASYLITTSASLDDLNHQVDTPIPMTRFRPNIVVNNDIPFDEDNWSELRIGDGATFHYIQPCLRCSVTTVIEETGVRDKGVQPLKALRRYRCRPPYGNVVPMFGCYMALDWTGPVKVGDPVYILRRRDAPSTL